MNTISFFHRNLPQMAATVCAAITSNSVLAFYGGMGLGKTTCIAAICRHLGVFETVSSPTYSIINQYQTASGSRIYHMDWYRLSGEAEALSAGVEDALYSGDLCFVEWPEIAPNLLPINTLHFHLSQSANGERILSWNQ